MDIFFYHSLSHWTLSAKWMYKKSLHIITYCIWLWRLGKILKSAPQKWKKLPISRAKNDQEYSIFFQSRSQKKRLKIRSKSDLVSRVKRDWKSDRKRIVRSDFDLFRSSSSLLWICQQRIKWIGRSQVTYFIRRPISNQIVTFFATD